MANPRGGGKTSFVLELRPRFRDIKGQFAKAEKQLFRSRQKEMRRLGGRLRDYYQEEAPKDTGEFAAGIRFRTFTSGETAGFRIFTPQPLGKWITQGTRPHIITPKGPGYPLRFYWEKVGRWVAFYRVHHPGTDPDDYAERATRRWESEARSALKSLSEQYRKTLTGL